MFDRLRKLGDAVGPLRASAQDLGRRELVPDYSPHDADDVVAMTSHLDRLPAQRGVGGTLWGDTVLVVANAVPIRTTRIGGPPLADDELGALVTPCMVDHYRMSLRLGAMTACSLASDRLLPRRFRSPALPLKRRPAM